jgi:predicted phage tail protein
MIQGAGGGGGGKGGGGQPSVPQEADDSLQSVQYASVLDLISEGEIQGIVGGPKGIYLDNTPVQSQSGTDNFTGYTIVTRNGTQIQGYIPDSGTKSIKPVGVEITNALSQTRTISNNPGNNPDRVQITVQLPALQIIEDDGDIVGHSVALRCKVNYNNGGYVTVFEDTITGKTTNSYQRDYMINMTGSFPVDIRLERISPDENSARRQNKTFWSSYTEITDEKFSYPNSALVGLRFDSRQFRSIPARRYKVDGIKVKLPDNAIVDLTAYPGRVTYNGMWNGAMESAAQWCSDPAWCLWDLLTNERYGVGIPVSTLDKFDFYAISQYCNELVDNGRGGMEPRFSCNVVLNSRDEVYNVIQEFVALFRGITYYGAGSMVVLQDKPADPQYLLTPANVIDGIFNYSGSSQKARHTTATVAYQTYESLGEVAYEYVEDATAVAKYGIINKDIKAVGCYSQGQAHRIGKWALLAEQNLTETCTFAVSIDSGIILRPGMVVDIADPLRAGSRRGGRISAATTTTVTLDDADGITIGSSSTISVLLPTGLVETRSITSLVGTVVTVSAAFSQAPAAQSIWVIQDTGLQTQQFRVVSVTESEPGIYGVTALEYNATIYAAIESNLKVQERDITNLSLQPEPPTAITATEHLYQDGQNVRTAVELSWIAPLSRVANYRIAYRLSNNNWEQVETSSPGIRLTGLDAGTLQVRIHSVNSIGAASIPANANITLLGKTAPPNDVQNLSFEAISYNSGRLRWDAATDLDVRVAGRVHIRHSGKTDGTGTWANSIDLIPAIAGYNTEAIVPLIEGEILVKFEDDGGRQSTNETSVIIDLPDAIAPLPVISRREDADSPPFQGDKDGTLYDSGDDVLAIDFAGSFDDIADLDALVSFDETGNVLGNGTYDFLNLLDLEGVFSIDLSRYFVTRGDYLSDQIDSRTATVDDWSDWDGQIPDKVNARMLVSHTNNNYSGTYSQTGTTVTVSVTGHGYSIGDTVEVDFTSGAGVNGSFTILSGGFTADAFTYTAATSQTTSGNVRLLGGGPWTTAQDMVNGTFKGRAFRFTAELSTQAPDQNILIDELGYDATFQRRTEHSDGAVASTAGAKVVAFTHPFWTGTTALGGSTTAYLPSIGITAHNLGTGEYFDVTSISGTGFTVTFKDSGGNAIDRNFNWSATGYGRGG